MKLYSSCCNVMILQTSMFPLQQENITVVEEMFLVRAKILQVGSVMSCSQL
jgi:hypothetical protein